MVTFVLVHGAWHGGWCWTRVARKLRAAGHEVHTPTLTGLGERAHLLTRDVDLDTHIADILGLFEAEEIEDAVLCGHSYAGMVITDVADRIADRLRAIVYLDAFVPDHGQSLFDLYGEDRTADARALAASDGDGWRMPPRPAAYFGVMNAKDAAWVDRRCVDQPMATYETKLSLTGAGKKIPRKVYILAEQHPNSGFGPFAEQTRDDPDWEYFGVASGHDVMVDKPDELTAILIDSAGD